MLRVEIPGRGTYELRHLVLDVNGTLAAGGTLIPGVADALAPLATQLVVVAVTADTLGTAATLGEALGIEVRVIERGDEGRQKRALVESLGAQATVAVGNGANDAAMLVAAAVGIAVIGREGVARVALEAADVVVTDILDALALLGDPRRLAATLRA